MSRRVLAVAAALVLALAGAAAAQPAGKSIGFEPKTEVDGQVLQVMVKTRALFRLDDGGLPVLDTVEQGQLTAAHPPGHANETYGLPGPGMLAAALDGSAEKHVSVLKVWNRTTRPIEYRAVVLEMMQGNTLHPVIVQTCPVPPGAAITESWPAPIAAVGMSRFKTASKAALARCGVGARPPGHKPTKKGK
jgi:hypothetical protein